MSSRTERQGRVNGDHRPNCAAPTRQSQTRSSNPTSEPKQEPISELLHTHGVAVRRRQLLFVAYVWTMSNGAITRRIGRVAWLFLPLAGPAHLLTAAALRRSLALQDNAVLHVRRIGHPLKVDIPSLLAIAVPLAATAWLPILAAPFYLPTKYVAHGIWAIVAVYLLLIPDLIAGPTWQAVNRARHRVPPVGNIATHNTAVVAGLAAYPREEATAVA